VARFASELHRGLLAPVAFGIVEAKPIVNGTFEPLAFV
jgi:hypothetical protein